MPGSMDSGLTAKHKSPINSSERRVVIMNTRRLTHVKTLCIMILVGFWSSYSFSQEQWKQKVDASLLANLNSGDTEIFFVYVKGEPDLAAAYGIKDWNERGWFVYRKLAETAQATQ